MDEASVTIGACGVVVAILLKRTHVKRNSRESRVWVRQWIKNRPNFGAYHQLVQELRMADESTF